jgi:hypothetical protein
MFFYVTNAVKKRMVVLFQDIFREHPIFNKVQVYTKFPADERPKYALLVRSVSGNDLKLGLDNFIADRVSFSNLANLQDVPGNSIEWVKDDINNLDKMSAPGFYIIKIISQDIDKNSFSFMVNPFLVVDDEELELQSHVSGNKMATVQNLPVNINSETIFAPSEGYDLKRDVDYEIDYETGIIVFKNNVVTEFESVAIDYQVVADPMGPFEAEYYMINNVAVPGVIIAFGDRIKVGDEQVVIVDKEQRLTAHVYGGRWEMTMDLMGISQDPDQQERIVDFAITMLWAEWQDKLVDEGINVFGFNLSGESEDLESELPEEYNFSGGISCTIQTDWELHVPVVNEVRKINYGYGLQSFKDELEDAPDAEYEAKEFDIRMINSKHQFGLQLVASPDPIVMQPTLIRPKTLLIRKK